MQDSSCLHHRVPRSLPLGASIRGEIQRAEMLLAEECTIANRAGCNVETEVMQVRDAAPAIIDEARDHHCDLIMLGQGSNTDHRVHDNMGKIIPYVLTHAQCRVWIVQEQQTA